MGLGTGLLLRMNTEAALRAMGVADAHVEVADISKARQLGSTADIVVTSSELAQQLGNITAKLITVTNFIDKKELETKLREALGNPE